MLTDTFWTRTSRVWTWWIRYIPILKPTRSWMPLYQWATRRRCSKRQKLLMWGLGRENKSQCWMEFQWLLRIIFMWKTCNAVLHHRCLKGLSLLLIRPLSPGSELVELWSLVRQTWMNSAWEAMVDSVIKEVWLEIQSIRITFLVDPALEVQRQLRASRLLEALALILVVQLASRVIVVVSMASSHHLEEFPDSV